MLLCDKIFQFIVNLGAEWYKTSFDSISLIRNTSLCKNTGSLNLLEDWPGMGEVDFDKLKLKTRDAIREHNHVVRFLANVFRDMSYTNDQAKVMIKSILCEQDSNEEVFHRLMDLYDTYECLRPFGQPSHSSTRMEADIRTKIENIKGEFHMLVAKRLLSTNPVNRNLTKEVAAYVHGSQSQDHARFLLVETGFLDPTSETAPPNCLPVKPETPAVQYTCKTEAQRTRPPAAAKLLAE